MHRSLLHPGAGQTTLLSPHSGVNYSVGLRLFLANAFVTLKDDVALLSSDSVEVITTQQSTRSSGTKFPSADLCSR
jgi:hypothetical protein